MIKQAYINGFMHKCAERGIDGRKLMRRVKIAEDNVIGYGDLIHDMDGDAGIGSKEDNNISYNTETPDHRVTDFFARRPLSYYGRLLANANDNSGRAAANLFNVSPIISRDTIKNRDLGDNRYLQALFNALDFGYPTGSIPNNRLEENLRRAGEQNHKNYLRTGTVPKRDKIDRTGIEELELTPEQEEQILEMQNTMAALARARAAGLA